ncbi:MAG: polysaccharide deacetylase family protein [Lachnospiraceae bacterium]|nr:polysaccharide deacetylase family protein [Lachnospiraceae bacterium]
MRRINRLITALLILLSAAGIVLAVLFLKKEQELETERQTRVAKLSAQLQPLNEKRNEWQAQNKEWQNRLAEKKKGKSCILLSFDNMSETLYETMFDMMDQYNFRATFALRNGIVPSWEEGYLTSEEFDEMMRRGWEYALSIGEMPEPSLDEEEDRDYREEQESESETEQGGKPESFQSRINDALASLEAAGMELPTTILCTAEQYEEIGETVLARKGFQMAGVIDEESFPSIAGKGDFIWRIDCGLYKQKDVDIETVLSVAIDNSESVAISINEVVKISKDASYDLSLMKFSSLLNYLKGQEEQGRINVLTYSEYYQYQEEQEREYEALTAEYAAFRQEMNSDMAALDAMEQEIVEEARSTEGHDTAGEAGVTEAQDTMEAESAEEQEQY